jgi:predicted Fe-Mo cluster-binding NifX family protein
MRVAIPVTESWLCPRFDCARRLVLVELGDGGQPHRRDVEIADWPAIGRANRLARLGVEMLICGGLCRWDAPALADARVTVIDEVSGPIDSILAALAANHLHGPCDYWPDPHLR